MPDSQTATGVQGRAGVIERVTLVAGLLALLTVGIYVYVYLQTQAWEILARAVGDVDRLVGISRGVVEFACKLKVVFAVCSQITQAYMLE